MRELRAEGLVKAYRERRRIPGRPRLGGTGADYLVLKDINLHLKGGEFTCILGPSGCGKSTLLRILAGFDRPTSGRVLIDGEPVRGPSPRHIFVFQEDGLFPWMTARENVAVGARFIPDPAERERRIREYLDLVGLEGFEEHYPHQLSGGMRRRAEVARALITNPEILFMDEPFGALDFVTRLQMREEMVNVHLMFETTLLFITHDIDEALHLGDRIVVLSDRPAEVKANISLPFPHPRDLGSGELADLRREIYFLMGLHAAL
ncbi:ABC transporter ATP-binding protein [Dissulfurirhabdus thermomarina]|uniref:ABC transporter ATP-binding protein n=1 Tax=Dissulfurirhabdus thermomarina TaxID=1765737 RepID=A0A6N9TN29_DISTH|nr:ABC transporter ATP-binding protein [Dissulfurirhabdus thermomarina]NDY41850.1 ABC transporter ATP-binding protein [Dissulfurirhabdus thermomarina]NMX22998.1 ABC transporter ATP-binding protein [Dissulfurirhabdus thermomarina]